MIDWHSHILPGIDDGSRNAAESLEMLAMLSEQGVSTVIATPHYNANFESPDAFIARRDAAYDTLGATLPKESPRILRGAEVQYYAGISKLAALESLCIEGSDILLLEMPFTAWTEMMINEVIHIAATRRITVMLAHIERYLHFAPRGTWQRLCAEGILLQTNASFYIARMSRRKALTMLREGTVHVIGSDCHNISERPPRLGQAYEIISKKCGDLFLKELSAWGNSLLT